MNIHEQRILILDFGSQYTQLIARRLRELNVYCEIHPYDYPDQEMAAFQPRGIILSGGPETVLENSTPRVSSMVFQLGCPVLGICYGMQTMAAQLGGAVENAGKREFGYARVDVIEPGELLKNIADHTDDSGQAALDVWMSHGDRVITLPPDFICMASTPNAPFAAMADPKRHFYGVQFHPEVTHTRQGQQLLRRFALTICGCDGLWTASNILEDAIDHVRQQVGSDHVILGLSGGVDSSVVAALLQRAIGEQLTCVFVDNGLLRLHEAEHVMATFAEHLGVRVIKVDAAQEFLSALKGVADPEQKRKIIGSVFIDVFQREAQKIKDAKWLAQGTIYPDVIESAATKTGTKKVIKSHHNVGGLPAHLHLQLLEPLRELFKDEVRELGIALGLPHDMVYRHPFPGPGLGVRVLGEVREEYLTILRQADAIFIELLHQYELYHQVKQAFAVFLPVKSVGVQGDARCYDYVIGLRAVETIDFMTAHWAHLPYELLAEASQRIINEVSGVSRVVYDISGKPPATIEWE
ncbi:MAG: glutamine-hydrolyzing GMP synthase [Gammaproteobacteria bacterium]